MTMGERLYQSIQYKGKERIEEQADWIIDRFQARYFPISFPQNISNMNKVYMLMENGYLDKLLPILAAIHFYSFEAELQYIVMNLGYSHRVTNPDCIYAGIEQFPSIHSLDVGRNWFELNTKLGIVRVATLQALRDQPVAEFARKYDCYALCHEATYEFLSQNPEYYGETSLIANQFGEKHYHSYIKTNEGCVDFANNVLWSRESFQIVMSPEKLNRVQGLTLDKALRGLNGDDLPDTYSPVLRLAVSKQLKNMPRK